MSNQNLIIYEFEELYKILSEIKKDININFEIASKNQLSEISQKSNSLIFTQKKISGVNNQIILINFSAYVQIIEKLI